MLICRLKSAKKYNLSKDFDDASKFYNSKEAMKDSS
jgi:hypothetical protein